MKINTNTKKEKNMDCWDFSFFVTRSSVLLRLKVPGLISNCGADNKQPLGLCCNLTKRLQNKK